VKGGNFLLCGEEDFLKEEAERALISSLLGSQSKRLNCDIYNAKEDHRDIFNALDTLSLFSDKKIIVIRDIEYLPELKKEPLLRYLKHPHKHISLILQSNKNAFSDKFIKMISSLVKTYSFKKLKAGRLRDWIHTRLKSHKKSITKEGLDLLLELKGEKNLFNLSGELEKLVTYKGEKSTITKDDIAELIGKSVTKRIYDLIDAISLKNRDSALLLARELYSKKQREIPEVMGFIGWQLRKMWRAKELLDQKKDEYSVARELKIRDFLIDKFLSQVKRFEIEELRRDFKLLVEADLSIKSGRGKNEFVLEQLIMKLCN